VQGENGCENWYIQGFTGTVHGFDECEGNPNIPFKVDSGTDDVINHFKKEISEDKIRLESEVVKIEYDQTGAKVILSSGEEFEADYVVYTGNYPNSMAILHVFLRIFGHVKGQSQ